MDLRTRLGIAYFVAALAAVFGFLALFRRPGGIGPALVAAFVTLLIVVPLVQRLFSRRALRRLNAAARAGDGGEMRLAIEDLRNAYRGSAIAIEQLRVQEAGAHMLDERWLDARKILEHLDEKRLGPQYTTVRRMILAQCLAQLGEHDRAVQWITSVRVPDGNRLQDSHAAALGIVYVLAGRAAEAAPLLERAVASRQEAAPYNRSVRGFYLGESLRALGRLDEARRAWTAAAEAHPDGRWGRRARARLDEPAPPPYR